MIRIKVPASTSNLGAGFDVFGLALKRYLQIDATVIENNSDEPLISVAGEGVGEISIDSDNLILQAARFAAEKEGTPFPKTRLAIHNQIPVSRGLGSSAAAIIAGLKLFEGVCGISLTTSKAISYAMEFESHPDNLSPALIGGLVVNCVPADGEVISLKLNWPDELKVVFVVPEFRLSTSVARDVLPASVSRQDAIFNIQRASLFVSALQQRRFDFLREAMRDRLHQPMRQQLIPGLEEILTLTAMDGFYGVALSGAGPSILALVDSRKDGIDKEIGDLIVSVFARHQIKSTWMALEIDEEGATVEGSL